MEYVVKRFGQNEFSVLARRFSKLVQIEYVKDYQSRSESMATKVHGMTKEVMKEVYIIELPSVIQKKVIKARLEDINEVFALASICEETDVAQENQH